MSKQNLNFKGHSYICTSIKDRSLHIDMREVNTVKLVKADISPTGQSLRFGSHLSLSLSLSLCLCQACYSTLQSLGIAKYFTSPCLKIWANPNQMWDVKVKQVDFCKGCKVISQEAKADISPSVYLYDIPSLLPSLSLSLSISSIFFFISNSLSSLSLSLISPSSFYLPLSFHLHIYLFSILDFLSLYLSISLSS